MRRIRLAALALAAALLLGLAGCAGNTVKVTVWRRGESAVALQELRQLGRGPEQ